VFNAEDNVKHDRSIIERVLCWRYFRPDANLFSSGVLCWQRAPQITG
jgi:hypothetical protein